MAEIHLASLRARSGFEKEVAIKRLHERHLGDRRIVELFSDEARIGALCSHPNVVQVHDAGDHDGMPFIAMELIQGSELAAICRRGIELGRFLPLAHAVDVVRQAAEGMAHFHALVGGDGVPLEIVHRDISPTNLLVTRDGVVKIIDFGIARVRGARDELGGAVAGKLSYMAPEQLRGEAIDARADLWSLGVVLYELTVGTRLFRGPADEVKQRILRGRVRPPTFVRHEFPPALEAIVMRVLEPHREDRYPSALALAEDLEAFLRDAKLVSGPTRIARYLDELEGLAGAVRRPDLDDLARAWDEDEGKGDLDFDRDFAARVAASPSPVALTAPRPRAPGPELAIADADDNDGDRGDHGDHGDHGDDGDDGDHADSAGAVGVPDGVTGRGGDDASAGNEEERPAGEGRGLRIAALGFALIGLAVALAWVID